MERQPRKEVIKLGKDYKDEIEKACRNMNELLDKQTQTPAEVDAIHHYAETIHYLTTAGAMNKAEEGGMFMDERSMRRGPVYDYSMDGQSMARGGRGGNRGGRGRGSYNDGRSMNDMYSERDRMDGESRGGRMPQEDYDWQVRINHK